MRGFLGLRVLVDGTTSGFCLGFVGIGGTSASAELDMGLSTSLAAVLAAFFVVAGLVAGLVAGFVAGLLAILSAGLTVAVDLVPFLPAAADLASGSLVGSGGVSSKTSASTGK